MKAKIEIFANADAIGLKTQHPTRSVYQPTGNFFMAFLALATGCTHKRRQKVQSRLRNIFQSKTFRWFDRNSRPQPVAFTSR
jgi:hypothetical protein